MLGRDVPGEVRDAGDGCAGSGEDDGPAGTLLDQRGHRGLDRVPHANDVDVDDVTEVRFVDLPRLHVVMYDPGVSDHRIDPAEGVKPGRKCLVDG